MAPSTRAEELIERLALVPHPEGGHYRETWRSGLTLPEEALPEGYHGERTAGTCIHYLLQAGEVSANHRVRSEELWLHHEGDPLVLRLAETLEDTGETVRLGTDDRYQCLVPGGMWQSACPEPGEHGYVLVSCVVVPGFDFADFEIDV